MKVWNLLEQFFKRNGMWLLEKIFARRVIRPTHVNFGKIHRILVVRQHDQLGDFLLSTPVFRALREHFPESHITALVRRYVAPVVENNPYVDDVLVFEEVGTRWTPRRLKDLWKGLRSDYDLAVVINTVSHSFTSDLLAHFSGARYVLGSEHLIFPGCRRNFFYNLIAPYWSGSRHQSERSLDIVRHLGIDTENRSELMALTEEEVRWAREFLAEHGVGENDLLISCHVGAGKLANRWPVESFAEAANRLHQTMQAHILVAWGDEEDELGEQFLDLINFEPIRAYGFSLRQLAALISCSNLYLGNDTGILHVAAAVDVPVVGVFGPTDPSVWLPIGEKFTAIRGEDGRCESVTVEAVVQRAQELIDLYTELPVMTEVDAVVESVQPPAEEEEAEEFDISEEVLENYLELLEKFEKGEQSGSVA